MSTILVVDDVAEIRSLLERELRGEGFEVILAENGDRGLELIEQHEIDLVLTDLVMPGIDGLELLSKIRERDGPYLPVILFTGVAISAGDLEEAFRRGADDYLMKPLSLEEVRLRIQARLRMKRIYEDLARITTERDEAALQRDQLRVQMARSVGAAGPLRTPGLSRLFDMLDSFRHSDTRALLVGETGTGKSLFARYMHEIGARQGRPFVTVHCASIPASLLAAELFGHERGAFTGADRRRIGRFEAAAGGTIFLDEIGDIPGDVQVALLRFLQEGEFERLGSSQTLRVDVRVIAATNCELEEAIGEGRFRSDLYYRLNVLGMQVPPLRERREDIPVLAGHFLAQSAFRAGKLITSFDPEAMDRLQLYDWPGNVRELESVVERAVMLSGGTRITPEEVHLFGYLTGKSDPSSVSGLRETVAETEQQLICAAIRQAGGNHSRAARALGIPRTTLVTKLKRYGVRG